MAEGPLESDWKIFRDRVPEWRERYLAQKNEEISAVLMDIKNTPTERFWNAKQLFKDEARILENCLDGHSRSKMALSLQLMFKYGLIKKIDLALFSEELIELIMSITTEIEN